MIDDHEALHQEADRLGLTNLTEHHLAQLARAKASATRFISALPRDLPMYAEPAHTFHAGNEGDSA